MAYLGADLVAVYALGYLSRHVDATTTRRGIQPLAFFWAPFLLVHLGGQDTITAFSMEDNSLWLRHLLNMVVQVVLATYIFWKSIGRHSMDLLISGIFVFVVSFIKYAERIWCLRCGSLENLESSTGDQYKHKSPQLHGVDYVDYSRTVCTGLHLMPKVLAVLTSRCFHILDECVRKDELFKLVGFELGVLHNDIYTKAVLLRTRSGIVLRFTSQIAMVIAFVLFHIAGNRQSYRRADIAVTYSLFIGGFVLEVCGVFIFLTSPWTWAWLKARGWNRLASLSWFLFSNGGTGWSEERLLLSNYVVGQYNLKGWLEHTEHPRSFSRCLMIMVTKLSTIFGTTQEKMFWLSKLLGREYTKGDKIMDCLLPNMLSGDYLRPRLLSTFARLSSGVSGRNDFGNLLVTMHVWTEAHLSRYSVTDANVSVEACRQLSRYMMYLLVTNPSLLPLDTSSVATLDRGRRSAVSDKDEFIRKLESMHPHPSTEALKELEGFWMWVIMYSAAKSRPEMHAALLGRGGELLTFVWLLLVHLDTGVHRSALSLFRTIGRKELIDDPMPGF
ncbi:unnamed protein product [Urochloa decumbens]|uniref:DUF4220 domain-containing protein n=1 Tax=Urochloa decumbens TaxID=240449 RepID=A0ABC9BU86_9POAL